MLPGLAASAVARALREDSCEALGDVAGPCFCVELGSWGPKKIWGAEAAKMGMTFLLMKIKTRKKNRDFNITMKKKRGFQQQE